MSIGSAISGAVVNEGELAAFAAVFAAALPAKLLIGLSGQLAAGKTTFTRYVLRALGYTGSVKSPTFTLVETYVCTRLTIHHFDLYRLVDAGELYFMGFDDFAAAQAVCLIEWPERGGGLMNELDVLLTFETVADTARQLELSVHSGAGERFVNAISVSKFFN